jgi:hypothetical protein
MTIPKLIFPENVLDQHLVVLGKTGAGKSSALRHIVEHLLSKGKRVCVIDPKGDWNGLKVSADGKGAGFPIILFGDFKEVAGKSIPADVPLNEYSGKPIAELVTSGNRPCVIGLRGWTMAAMHRFWVEFASTFFNTNEGEIYLVVDEVHNFAPKGSLKGKEGNVSNSLHWTNRLLSEARGLGAVMLIASQRPQKVHNDTLTACETLVAMRVIHKADRDAVDDWIKGNGDKDVSAEVLNSLAGMKRGEAYVWSPEVEFGPERLTFPMFTTYDSFAPPQLQKKISGKDWATVDLDQVREKLAAVIEKAKAEDPRELQKKVRDLEGQIRKLENAKPAPAEKIETQVIEKPALTDADFKRFEKALARLGADVDRVEKSRETIEGVKLELEVKLNQVRDSQNVPIDITEPRPAPRPVHASPPALPSPSERATRDLPTSDGDLSGPQLATLRAAARLQLTGVVAPSLVQVAVVRGVSHTTGSFQDDVRKVVAAGYLERRPGSAVEVTAAGVKAAGDVKAIRTLSEFIDFWYQHLPRPRADLLRQIVNAYPLQITREQLAASLNKSHTTGSFQDDVRKLKKLGLVRFEPGSAVRAADLLFLPGLR